MELDKDTIRLFHTMAFRRTATMKVIYEKVMTLKHADRNDRWLAFTAELHLPRIDEYINQVIDIVIDTWLAWDASLNRLQNQTCDIIHISPDWELYRFVSPQFSRDWPARWKAAAEAVNWEGVKRRTRKMIARKDSPIWGALGNGAGGYDDTWGLPYPPFAIGSGMDWLEPE